MSRFGLFGSGRSGFRLDRTQLVNSFVAQSLEIVGSGNLVQLLVADDAVLSGADVVSLGARIGSDAPAVDSLYATKTMANGVPCLNFAGDTADTLIRGYSLTTASRKSVLAIADAGIYAPSDFLSLAGSNYTTGYPRLVSQSGTRAWIDSKGTFYYQGAGASTYGWNTGFSAVCTYGTASTADLYLGSFPAFPSRNWNGNFYGGLVAGTELTATQVKDLHNAARATIAPFLPEAV